MRASPWVTALDADRDGVVSVAELAAAPTALRALDKDNDGRITVSEVMPPRPPEPGAPSSAPLAPELVNTLFSFDENQDGKLSKAEVPERMQGIFARADSNADGLLTRDELTKATTAQERSTTERRGGPPDPVFRALDRDQDGAVSPAELAAASASLKSLDQDGDGALQPQELRPMRGAREGGRGPAEMIDHLFADNDSNHDGKLSKAEMPERLRETFARWDADQDGFVTKAELAKGLAEGRP